jgi:hypothetical protein
VPDVKIAQQAARIVSTSMPHTPTHIAKTTIENLNMLNLSGPAVKPGLKIN